ncbi:glucose-1-phosphate adenylyltransferase (ADP-glucose pyrophosphorylase) subunit alpha [Petrocella atlantisensis]|uniref:Glucose-1-phosphate adenylyltransferase n=1 Tax=Petrocella atlantisensis TaxID=2173034 RepID=A0A3P7S532_9FIRM|nr:glucose-1-phosphate adenylyltransferase [Petrocella atlantisensis]VDN47579.1 glucose-1-phosphate adenylyltransferase (ADP-glucose pyrophosphorylase) subunit alpha [Petrocella atlantisensis]
MRKKEIVAMLLAGGQGSRLGILTSHVAKPAVSFGGKYRIIDFTLSNCINSGIDTVGVLTQYQPLLLNQHIGIGIPWDLDKNFGGVTILPPFVSKDNNAWYTGTANAVYQNIPYIDYYNPEYVLILSGDHIYKMDYEMMLNYHKKKKADVTIAVYKVPMEEAHRFGLMKTEEDAKIIDFEEKPQNPTSDLASMGIYIFNWKAFRQALILSEETHEDSDFGKHILPYMLNKNYNLYAYEFDGFWKDVGTLEAYWEANMQLIDLVPEFNLYESYWKIYTKNAIQPPQFIAKGASVEMCILGEGAEIYGHVYNSVIGSNVIIEKDAVIRDSIIMNNAVVGEGVQVFKSIIAEKARIGANTKIGVGEDVINETQPHIYYSGISVIGEKTVIPPNIEIGKNCAIDGPVTLSSFADSKLTSGKSLISEEGSD